MKGGPKCPGTVAKGAGVVAWLKDGGWGPRPMRTAQERCWLRLTAWIKEGRWRRGQGDDDMKVKDVRAVDSVNHPDFGRSARDQIKGAGAAVYRLIWSMDHEAAFRRWTSQRSAQRWLPLQMAPAVPSHNMFMMMMRAMVHAMVLLIMLMAMGGKRRRTLQSVDLQHNPEVHQQKRTSGDDDHDNYCDDKSKHEI